MANHWPVRNPIHSSIPRSLPNPRRRHRLNSSAEITTIIRITTQIQSHTRPQAQILVVNRLAKTNSMLRVNLANSESKAKIPEFDLTGLEIVDVMYKAKKR